MAEEGRRRSIAVVGFSPEDSLALLEDDRSFFGELSDSESTSSDDPSAPDSTSELESDAEENFDLVEQWRIQDLAEGRARSAPAPEGGNRWGSGGPPPEKFEKLGAKCLILGTS